MRVNEVVEITKGALLTTPSITAFLRIVCDARVVQKGDLFIAKDKSQIPHAIAAGAYGIICTPHTEVSDAEIAWIVVENMQECLTRLIRYKLLAKNITTIYVSAIEYAIAKEIVCDERARFCNEDLYAFIELLNDEIAFIFTHNEQILELSFEALKAHIPNKRPFLVLSHTLFDSTIFYKSAHYRINLPKLFFNELSAVLNVCENKQIQYALSHFKHIPFFKPNFLNSLGQVIEYGQASKVAIAEKDIEQFKKYMAYIANNATWGRILFLVPLVYLELFNQIGQTFAYKTDDELCEYIHNENFNFALILGIDDTSLMHALSTHRKQVIEPNLFSNMLEDAPVYERLF
ncbi:hypothetical protein LS71_001555 [Helicobacter jaachi]|uniref:Ferrochelatase n=1 Tax=Helicobacter jaachi TaxID=1677920 RepID=A0A4U8TCR5_9HELI|nr:hypothetical protein [Helicobacter jaachi]TLD97464.1 hypothetical protein LS71_001555 [Helicobacter jaachi]